MIEVSHVSRSYGDTVVVDDVSLQLARGGITAIIGPNGAGKSSLLSMIARLIPMSAGSIHVDGLDVRKAPSDALAKRLAILRQDNHIGARLTVRELVCFGRFPHSRGRMTAEDDAHVDRAIGYLGLQDYADCFIDELSGGQRQRAFVAMVLCQDTDYMLFDEPLNNLDVRYAVDMMRLLRQAARGMGKTIVVVLHDINFASAYATHIIAMKKGRVFMQGSPAEIIQADVLATIYETAFEVHELGDKRIVTYYD
ncbi:iron ABC transporter ATP-binding protein [Lampropedia cohaerens]|uniref:Iron ABC transporter ATP-binding protein n=1 Tax=Lampropedia cohaerens TaxID=1610491 RepID=A0A0U1Q081_9BURK|nr:ATP-binding cassette domain-containing protein [Lampropedia cohaerens]KKW68173.1 iron ABC transporter ATP-binding protein [Lampropedia cohaerens]